MGILYPLENYKTWAKRYDIEIKSAYCIKCGKTIITSIPFALGKLRGLIADAHECETKSFVSVVFKDKKHKSSLKLIV